MVEESLGFELTGEGEHLCLWLEKRGLNTQYIAEQLSQFITTRLLNIGYSGLKDRHGVTSQWFSIPVKIGAEFDEVGFCQRINEKNPQEQISILLQKRHQKKIRRGVHRANRFQIRLRSLSYDGRDSEEGKCKIDLQLEKIQQCGFPNYFGEQRFGRDNQNVSRGLEWLNSGTASKLKPAKRGIYLSAIRSYLFNQVLAKRVVNGSWCKILPAETIMLDGSHSVFQAEESELETLQNRLQDKDIHPTGPLFGGINDRDNDNAGDSVSEESELSQLEYSISEPFIDSFRQGVMQQMKPARRSLRAVPEAMQWSWEGADLVLTFSLPSGSYATALIRELGSYL